MKASDVFVKSLENEGVEFVFGVPGEENLDLVESLRKSRIRLVVTRHEQAAAFMAATYGRLTGRAGVCMSTLGPGALNLVTGVAHAQLGGMPLVAITGQKGVRENWQAKFQLIDVVSTMKPLTKMARSIVQPKNIPSIVREAFKTAEAERPGAVHIELPEDIAQEDVPAADSMPLRREETRRPAPDHKALKRAVQMLLNAKKPLVIVSAGGNRKPVSKALTEFAERTGIFVTHTQLGKGVLADDNKKSLFTIGIHKADYVHCGISQADLVITVGYDLTEYPPSIWNKAKDKKIIHVDFRPAEIEAYYNPSLELVGDISKILKILGKELARRKPEYDLDYFAKLRSFLEEKFSEKSADEGFPLKPQRIVADIRKAMGRSDILSLDNGIYKLWISRIYNALEPNTVLLDNTLATMGAGLPAAMAAKLVRPEKNVLAVVGDGGFMMNSQELETAVRLKQNIVVLILNDNAYGFIKWKQKSMGLPDFAMDYGNPDFKKYAEAYGAKGFDVKSAGQLLPTLKKAFSVKGPVLINCPIDYSENYEVFNKELGSLVCPV